MRSSKRELTQLGSFRLASGQEADQKPALEISKKENVMSEKGSNRAVLADGEHPDQQCHLTRP